MSRSPITKRRAMVAGIAVVAAVAGIGAPAAIGDHKVRASATSVSVRDNYYSPKNKSVSVDTTVTWRWRGDNQHNVKFTSVPSGASKRGAGFKTSGSFSKTFRADGTYRYLCTLHEGMRGTVKVSD